MEKSQRVALVGRAKVAKRQSDTSDQSRMDVHGKKSKEAWEMVTPMGCASMKKGEMVCLCASHMNTLGRWERFMQMLTSWKEQTVEVPLIVSMSFEESVEDVIKPTGDGGANDNPTEAEDVSVRALQGAGRAGLGRWDVGDVHRRRRPVAPSARGGVRDYGPRMQETEYRLQLGQPHLPSLLMMSPHCFGIQGIHQRR